MSPLTNRHKTRPQRVLYDLSFTCTSGKTSGIERVVRSLLREGEKGVQRLQHLHGPVEFVPVFSAHGKFYRWDANAQSVLGRVADVERDCLETAPAAYRHLARGLCLCLPHPAVKRNLMPPSGHLGIFKPWFRRWKRDSLARAAAGKAAIRMSPRDILWLADAYWAQPTVWPAVARAKKQGAWVAALVYDLIPLRSNQTNPGFCAYLDHVLSQADVGLCISDCERLSLLDYQAQSPHLHAGCRDFRSIALGCEFDQTTDFVRPQFTIPFSKQPGCAGDPQGSPSETIAHVSEAGRSALTSVAVHPAKSDPVYLCVNTFEPRKNHTYLLDAFEKLWASGSSAKLCLIGRVGWQSQTVLERISQHAELNRRLFSFHDASDAEVNYCYTQARAVITASKDEGFGLPVVESLSRERTTFASDIPIHREVGGEACHYFDLERVEELTQLIYRDQRDELELPRRAGCKAGQLPKIYSWRESFDQCWAELLASFQQRRADEAPLRSRPSMNPGIKTA